MADPKGFLKITERELPADRDPRDRVRDYLELHGQLPLTNVSQQASRCMDCGVPFCHFSCPLGNIIPEWNDLVWREQWEAASERLHATNNFPEVTGRVCPAPCEYGCVLGINQPQVTIKNIEYTIAEQAWERNLISPQIPDQMTGYTVAVVGSGPSGLAAAQQLTRAGHTVAVYERADKIGGLLQYGIPEYKLPKGVLARRLEQMEAEGTTFRSGVNVGVDVTGVHLREAYDAVVLALGATVPRDLPVEGRELEGVHQAMEFLPAQTKALYDSENPVSPINAAGKDVVVIGGGDTGADCIGTSWRQGARSVTSLEITPQAPTERPADWPWPTYPRLYKVASSHEEGGEILYSTSTLRFLPGEDGKLAALEITEVKFEGGRPVPVPGTTREIPAQLVLLAMGFTSVGNPELLSQLGLPTDERGRIERGEDYTTAVPGVFVAGDAGRGQSLVVWAIAEGRAAAASVDKYLRGRTELPVPIGSSEVSFRP